MKLPRLPTEFWAKTTPTLEYIMMGAIVGVTAGDVWQYHWHDPWAAWLGAVALIALIGNRAWRGLAMRWRQLCLEQQETNRELLHTVENMQRANQTLISILRGEFIHPEGTHDDQRGSATTQSHGCSQVH